MGILPIRRVLISLTDKTGVEKLAAKMHALGIEIISTSNTAKVIESSGIPVTPIQDFTGSPEVMDGRVKTLHPRVHGGILFVREDEQHVDDLATLGSRPIDAVICNLYEFKKTVENPGKTDDEIIEAIDIGGPSMLRSAAKNHKYVTVITDPEDYPALIEQLTEYGGTTLKFRRVCAKKAFELTANYEAAIADYFELGKPTI